VKEDDEPVDEIEDEDEDEEQVEFINNQDAL
jgi:hypothetical protein